MCDAIKQGLRAYLTETEAYVKSIRLGGSKLRAKSGLSHLAIEWMYTDYTSPAEHHMSSMCYPH